MYVVSVFLCVHANVIFKANMRSYRVLFYNLLYQIRECLLVSTPSCAHYCQCVIVLAYASGDPVVSPAVAHKDTAARVLNCL